MARRRGWTIAMVLLPAALGAAVAAVQDSVAGAGQREEPAPADRRPETGQMGPV